MTDSLLREIHLREQLTHDTRRAPALAGLSERCDIPRWRLWYAAEISSDALTAAERVRIDVVLIADNGDANGN